MTTELAQRTDMLMVNALETAKQLRELAESSVAEAIFESVVENENGKEIQFERPISDLAYAAFLQLEALVEALEAKEEQRANWFHMTEKLGSELDIAEKRIAELERMESTLRAVGVMSQKAYCRLENRESRFIALWPRPEIYLPRKRPDDGVIVYARTAGIQVIEGEQNNG
ncbi:hypothetical protein [Pseudocitrobacter sp. RIT415]|uniref:hypothetical protein n=1 Tax=Pseudocitrobacter sp. RIT415 TaxID=2202163 RepID=UPI001F39C20A|nr:hypothetical protein [Pseudocitrobacter sp. RIT 415]